MLQLQRHMWSQTENKGGEKKCWNTMATLPFKNLPDLMTIEIVHLVATFPMTSGISRVWSPCEIVGRHKLNVTKHCKIPFGAYCVVHDEPNMTNSMEPRTHEKRSFGPMGNMQKPYLFFCSKETH